MKNRVVLGMSGGVDSSTSAYLLQEEGYEVIGVTLICTDEQLESEDLKDAKKIADKLGIKHIIYDVRERFKELVINYFLDGYSKGITPSPCIICDELVKIENLKKVADEENAFYIATGHYCETEFNIEFNRYLLKRAEDRKKDQTYMLYRVKSEILERMIFPLAKYEKKVVRERAKKYDLSVSEKKDSQGICFAKEGYIKFLKEELKEKIKKGKFVDKEGRVLGEHQGYQLYTIGQRRGLGVVFPRVYFIIDIIPEKNQIVLGDYSELDRECVELINFSTTIPFDKLEELVILGKPRFSSSGFLGKILKKDDKIYFKYEIKNPQNASGQHLVLYYGEYVVGGGEIKL